MKELPKITLSTGPRQREWGKSQRQGSPADSVYNKPVGFVKEGGSGSGGGGSSDGVQKTDLELEEERKEARRRDEMNSFRDVSLLTTIPVCQY